jgi:trk system potassium uptake protein TrkA
LLGGFFDVVHVEKTMNVLIVGCGREGSEMARSMSQQGHSVTIVDSDPTHFDRLGPDFKGRTVQGFSFDRGVLERAGIAHAEAFAATTQSDNENIVAAKIARDVFKVQRVVARVYNPGRREVYERLGLQTVTSTSWGARRLEQILLHPGVIDMEQIGHGDVRLLNVRVPEAWHEQPVTEILDGNAVVCAIERNGHAFVPRPEERLQPNDLVYLCIPDTLLSQLLAIAPVAAPAQ